MELIPVIDLMHGQVVHAREGMRSAYAPVRSRLCKGADPAVVLQALLDLHPFRKVYFADLDAIQRRGDHHRVLAQLHDRFPAMAFWVDTGIADEAALQRWIASGIGRPVIGSESLEDAGLLARAIDRPDTGPVLSLDFFGEAFRGPEEVLSAPSQWPRSVLAMNLRRVGSEAGPDLALISRLAALAPRCRVYASGGIRSIDDIVEARAAGAAGALLATALHDGRIDADALRDFAAIAPPGKNQDQPGGAGRS